MTTHLAGSAVDSTVYSDVLHFYARQMQMLDDGDFSGYAATFTPDGTFCHTPDIPPARGYAGIVDELNRFHDERFASDPVVRRHYFNQIRATMVDDQIYTRLYALIVTTRPPKRVAVTPSCVVEDVLTVGADGLLAQSRNVFHDELADSTALSG